MQFEYLITRNKGYYCCLLGSGSRKREHVKCSTYTNSCGAHDNKSQHRSYNMRIMHLYVLLNNDRGSWYAGACTPPRSVFLNWPGVPSARKNDKVFHKAVERLFILFLNSLKLWRIYIIHCYFLLTPHVEHANDTRRGMMHFILFQNQYIFT